MRIYLIRHGPAVSGGEGLADAHRCLSAEGRRVVRAVGRRLREEGHAFAAVLASPLVRAVQTAELLAEATDFLGLVEATPALAPSASMGVVARSLRGRGDAVALVGHAPTISELGAILAQRPAFPPLLAGHVCLLEDGEPRWSLRPDTLSYEPLLVA